MGSVPATASRRGATSPSRSRWNSSDSRTNNGLTSSDYSDRRLSLNGYAYVAAVAVDAGGTVGAGLNQTGVLLGIRHTF